MFRNINTNIASIISSHQFLDLYSNWRCKKLCNFTTYKAFPCTDSTVRELANGPFFLISDESGNRFFPTVVADYWQDRVSIAYQQTDFFRSFSRICAHFPIWNCQSRMTAIWVSMSSQKLHNVYIKLQIVSISSIHNLVHKQVHGHWVL